MRHCINFKYEYFCTVCGVLKIIHILYTVILPCELSISTSMESICNERHSVSGCCSRSSYSVVKNLRYVGG
jgi:hypothetical protein